MKFKYDLSNSFSRYMNLACGVYFKKKIIRNYKNKKTHGLVFYMIMLTLLLILMLIVVCCLMDFFNLDEANNKKIIEIFIYIFFLFHVSVCLTLRLVVLFLKQRRCLREI